MSALLIAVCNKLKVENNLTFEIGKCSEANLNLFSRNGLVSHIENNRLLKSYDYKKTTVSAKLFHANDEQDFYDYIDKDLLSHSSLNILDAVAKDHLRQSFFETFNNQ